MSTTSRIRRKSAFTRTTVRIENDLLEKVDALVADGNRQAVAGVLVS